MCTPPDRAPSTGAVRFEAWARQVAGAASGVCNSAKAHHVLMTKTAELIRYCLSRTTDASARQAGQQELQSIENSAKESAQTVAQSCS